MTSARQPGDYLKAERQRAKMRQVDLCKMIDISQPMLSQVESGSKKLSERIAGRAEIALNLKRGTLLRWSPDLPATLRSALKSADPGLLRSLQLSVFPRARSVNSPVAVPA